jgi:hypothetical protein
VVKTKYGRYIVTELKPRTRKPDVERTRTMTDVFRLDDDVIKGAMYVECVWFRKGSDTGNEAHTHDFDEFLTFWGTNPDDPHDLCGEVELWLEDEKHIITKSCLVYIPAGMKHCPMIVRRVDKPILHFSAGTIKRYEREAK